jgi:hypothetical protein
MPEKAPHPDTYESPTTIPTFIEGGTLDNEGSHNVELSNLPKTLPNGEVINLYVTSSHPNSIYPDNIDIHNNLFNSDFSTNFSIPENEHFDIDYNLSNKLGYSPIINKFTIEFGDSSNQRHKQLQISGSFNSDDWVALGEELTPSTLQTREFIFENNVAYNYYRLRFKSDQFTDPYPSPTSDMSIQEIKYFSHPPFLDYNSVAEVQGHLTGSEYLPRGIDVEGTQLNSLLPPVILNLAKDFDSTFVDYGNTWNLIAYNSPIQENIVEALFKAFHPNLYGTPDYSTESEMSDLLKYSIQLIKNNDAAVYWPSYNFNGIGDALPGQGYQIRLGKLRLYEGHLVGVGGHDEIATISPSDGIPILGLEYGINSNYLYGTVLSTQALLSPRVAAFKFRPLDPIFILNTTPDAYKQLVNNIEIDLLEGWNIIGYTGFQQGDMVDILFQVFFPDLDPNTADKHTKIGEKMSIIKDNYAAVYWPEYSFNGIGDILPGQGYQIRMHEAATIKWPATTYPTSSNGEFSYYDD